MRATNRNEAIAEALRRGLLAGEPRGRRKVSTGVAFGRR
jgi:hypothetical protein